ncbi:MAG: hypothetical protein KTR35_01425 [Gammaproteobacteria bacterium]|nr:hypothetical protein [Gammaproteobacteria bacterium]
MSTTNTTNPKLSRRLKRALLATLLAMLVLATIAAAASAYFEASDIQDETLLSVARLAETNQIGTQSNQKLFDDDHLDDSAVRVWETSGKSRDGFSLKKSIRAGFHTIHEDDDFWRVYVTRQDRNGNRYAVAQKLSVSAELALKSATNTAIPLLLLFLLIPLLITLIVRHSFKPLNTLTEKVGSGDSLKLDLANENEIPVEVLPFISAIDSLLKKNDAYNSRQRRFIADAAHELRTPITALSLEIENVRAAPSEEIKQQRQAALEKSVTRLQRLLNQLLDLARAQSQTDTTTTTISLNELVKTQIAENYPLVESKHIEISVDRNEPVHVIDINHQLQHLVRNALSNAIKFAPEHGHIQIECYPDSGQAVFTVSDDGPGVSNEDLNQLHEPFYRPEGQASGNGAGLGLAICQEIAAQLNGNLTFNNLEPTGFEFCYRQPLAIE